MTQQLGRRRARSAADQGFVTVAMLALTAVVLALGAFLVALGEVQVVRHRAAAAADLAALAGGRHLLEGAAAPCSAARQVAVAQQARILACTSTGRAVTVRVEVRPAGLLGRYGGASATARAGWDPP